MGNPRPSYFAGRNVCRKTCRIVNVGRKYKGTLNKIVKNERETR